MTWKVPFTKKSHVDFPPPPQGVYQTYCPPEGPGSLIILPATNRFKPDTFEGLFGTGGDLVVDFHSVRFTLDVLDRNSSLIFSGYDRHLYGSGQSTKLASLFLLDGSMMSAWRIIWVSSVHEA